MQEKSKMRWSMCVVLWLEKTGKEVVSWDTILVEKPSDFTH